MPCSVSFEPSASGAGCVRRAARFGRSTATRSEAQGGKACSYSQFCARLKAHQGSCGGSAQMHFDYEPGLYGMADFSGKTLALRTGRGETDVEIFVAVLAHSNLIYAEAVGRPDGAPLDDGPPARA